MNQTENFQKKVVEFYQTDIQDSQEPDDDYYDEVADPFHSHGEQIKSDFANLLDLNSYTEFSHTEQG